MGQVPDNVLTYSQMLKAATAARGAKIKKATKELNKAKNILPSGERKKRIIATNVRIVDVTCFNSEEFGLPSPPGGRNIRSDVDDR